MFFKLRCFLIFIWLLIYILPNVGVEFFHTVRTDAVAEYRFGMIAYIFFNLPPVAAVITDIFAVSADGYDAA